MRNVNMEVIQLVLEMVRPTRPLLLCANIFHHCNVW